MILANPPARPVNMSDFDTFFFTGLHISLLYLWQIEAVQAMDLKPIARLLGIYVMEAGASHLAEQVGRRV